MTKIKIGVVDDHTLFRKGMATMLGLVDDMEVVLEAENGEHLFQQLPHKDVDVLLLDLEMPVMDGHTALKKAQVEYPDLRIIIVSMLDDESHILAQLEAGARGYLLKESAVEEVQAAIRTAAAGGYHCDAKISQMMMRRLSGQPTARPDSTAVPDLSPRELEVLKLICQQMTNAEIADALHISRRTVDGHRNNLLQKTGARNTAGLVIFAMRNGLAEDV
ncbi:MAG: response regulator transcription factor [Bacteroidota bacterium]